MTGAIGGAIAILWLLIYRGPKDVVMLERVPAVPWRVVLRQPYILEMLGTRIMTDSVWYFFLFWASKYMQESHGLSLKAIGMTLWGPT
jgi:ACS family hexuronate transporter-like MFS transporter